MATIITKAEYLVIDNVPFATPAWWLTSLAALRDTPEQRGRNKTIPGRPGTKSYRRRVDETRKLFPIIIDGRFNPDGTPNADGWAGLDAHLDYLRAFVLDPTNVGDGTRTAVWHRRGGGTRTAQVQVAGPLDLVEDDGAPIARGVLDLAIPEGAFA